MPGRNEPASGGIVKLQDLSEVFPNCRWRANALYLISSCYPWTVRWQVRVARFFGAKIVLNQNGVAYPAWRPEAWEEENERAAWVFRRADAVVFQSEFCRRCALEWLKVVEPEISRILLNPVDLAVFRPKDCSIGCEGDDVVAAETEVSSLAPSSVSRRMLHPGRPFYILLAGSHQFAYRVRTALEALVHLDEQFAMIIAGAYNWSDSEERARAEAAEWADALGIANRVEFRGRYLQSEAPALLGEADVLLHTKVMDPCPRLVAEALACGLPVVYAASGGLSEMVAQNAGIGIPSEENFDQEKPAAPDRFADAILRIRERYEDWSRHARKCAEERFDSGRWIEAHREILRSIGCETDE